MGLRQAAGRQTVEVLFVYFANKVGKQPKEAMSEPR